MKFEYLPEPEEEVEEVRVVRTKKFELTPMTEEECYFGNGDAAA